MNNEGSSETQIKSKTTTNIIDESYKKKKKKKDQLKRNSTVKYYINCILQSYATSDKIFNKFRRHI